MKAKTKTKRLNQHKSQMFDQHLSYGKQDITYYDIDPEMVMLGKALGNGCAITAVIGKRAVMEAAHSTFISSTFWTEHIGPTAALKTLEIMERERSREKITNTGKTLRNRWQDLADCHSIEIIRSGLPALTGYSLKSKDSLKCKTFLTRKMLKKGYLKNTICFSRLSHTKEVIDNYFNKLDSIFEKIAERKKGLHQIDDLLEGPACHNDFKKLN